MDDYACGVKGVGHREWGKDVWRSMAQCAGLELAEMRQVFSTALYW